MPSKISYIKCQPIRRAAFWCASVIVVMPVLAQPASAPASSSTSPSADQPVEMSAFQVTTTQGEGYIADNTATAFKTNESLMAIPQVDVVVTRDMINDIGQAEATEVLQYFGLNSIYADSNDVTIRGGGAIVTPFVDEMPTSGLPYGDNAAIDSYEVIKGPAQALYLSNSLSGLVLEATKKPLPYSQNIVTASVNSFGSIRGMIDSTGPFGTIGGAKLSYRVVASYEHDESYFVNVDENSTVLFPEIQIQLRNTTVRIYDMDLHMLHTPEANGLITATGKLYTGMGWKNAMNMVRGTMEQHDSNQVYASFDTRLSDNWENRFAAEGRFSRRYGANAVNIDANYINDTMSYIARLNDIESYDWTMLWDVQGHYTWGILKESDAFGWSYSDHIEKDHLWSGATGAIPSFPETTVSILNPAQYQSLVVPASYQYSENLIYPNVGSHNETENAAIYWAHSTDIIPHWVSLTGGLTWDAITTYSTPQISSLPYQTTTVASQQLVHRVGVIVNPLGTQDLSVYALESTTYSPVSGGQLLATGQLPPAQSGKDDEVGFKTAFLGGKISTDFAVFHMTLDNVLNGGAVAPNGSIFYTPIGSLVQKGFDGNIGISVLPGLQFVGTFFSGSNTATNGYPVPGSYPNSWTVVGRYDFQSQGPLKGLALGAGFVRLGGQYVSYTGLFESNDLTPWQKNSGEIKLETGSLLKLFAVYAPNKHWLFRLSCDNALNEAYPTGAQIPSIADASVPIDFTLEADYKF